jgi:hydrogenase maturation factor
MQGSTRYGLDGMDMYFPMNGAFDPAQAQMIVGDCICIHREFRMKWMNEDEATAKAALPKMQDMTTEGQEEVE